jgi:DNA-binding NarL/FixJ family response regulator
VSSVSASPRRIRRDDHLDRASLEELVLVCLEGLADLAREGGQTRRAARLLEAAALLHEEPRPANSAVLSERESQVAWLVAHGLSNRQIARELVVSDRTVDSHVSNVLRKLSLTSRAQIAAWVVRRDHRPIEPGSNVWTLRTVTASEVAAKLAD